MGLVLAHGKHILALSREPSTSALQRQPGLSAAIQTVLVLFAVLQSLQQGPCPTESMTVEMVAPLIRAREEAHIEALVHMFESGPGPAPEIHPLGWAAHMIVDSALALSLEQRSVLMIPTSGGDHLGWVVSRRLAKSSRLSKTELTREIDVKLLEIADTFARDNVEFRILRLFDGQTPQPLLVTDEITKRR
jgi:hypothetical protein